ncbi:MAG: HlyD family efflux transporter periplasmic adaptor subunit [Rhizonema sp. NSF051]|nr:HlyD family efflux transporter periplasmic adaptor subunit [Rhizonema sp. NSF051]
MSRVSEKPSLREQAVEKPKVWWLLTALPLVIAVGMLGVAKIAQIKKTTAPPTLNTAPIVNNINALGRLEPRGDVIKISASASGVQGVSRVEEVLVKEGERVKKGQFIAILDTFASNQATIEEANAKLRESRGNLANVKVGSPRDIQAQTAVIARLEAQFTGENAAQQATIARLEAELNGENVAQQATISRLQAQLYGQTDSSRATVRRTEAQASNAQVEAQRYETLYREGAISEQQRNQRRLDAETTDQQVVESQANRTQTISTVKGQIAEARANLVKSIETIRQQIVEAKANRSKTLNTLQKQIDEERAKLKRLQEIRPANVEVAQAQVSNAIASVKKAEADLKLSYVKAPIAGEILKIYTKAGESINQNGIAEIGRTDQMIAIAEVPEDSIRKVRLGQQATITSNNGAFIGQLQGTVFEIGRKIGKKDVLNTDPAADIDARVVEVKIALTPQDSQKVAGLTYAKIVVDINE